MMKNQDGWDENSYRSVVQALNEVFRVHEQEMQGVKQLARQIHHGVREISPFIECLTSSVCPSCTDVCCINKHGYHNFEDLIYMHALNLTPPLPDFRRKESDPCAFLTPTGCIMERFVRPSGCNWYFCDSLFDAMEIRSDYTAFDEALGHIAELWLEMVNEFREAGSRLKS
jgi:hypothetical protein